MKIEDYVAITSNTAATTTTNTSGTSEKSSFEQALGSAADRLVDKVSHCDTTSISSSSGSNTDLEALMQANSTSSKLKKLAEIQTAIEEANAKRQENTFQKDHVSNKITSHAGQASCQVYNEGKLRCSDELNEYFLAASEKYGVDVKLLKAVAFVESSFRPNATSKCGAMGIMQLMPSAAKQYGAKDAYDPEQNIMAGAKILSTFLKRYDGDIEKTLAAYNAGPGNVKKAGGVPSYARGYVDKVLKYYNL